jgi:hypothetical protein
LRQRLEEAKGSLGEAEKRLIEQSMMREQAVKEGERMEKELREMWKEREQMNDHI